MPITYQEAIKIIFTPGFVAWPGIIAALGLPASQLFSQGLPEGTPDTDDYFGRLSQRTVTRGQKTFRNGPEKRYRTEGMLIVQVMAPMSQAEAGSFAKGRAICEGLQSVYTSYPKNQSVEFLNIRIEELPNDGKRFRFNVIAEYNYDDIG